VSRDYPFREIGDREFGSPAIESSDSRDDKPDERTRFLRRISGSVTTVRCEEEMQALSRGANAQ
jgi:hypothetical protein